MKVFLDTNVLVSAVATRGLCADVLREVLARQELIVSPELLHELEIGLEEKLALPRGIITEFIELVKEDSFFIQTNELLDIDLQDKSDLPIISAASISGADCFITGDKELLELAAVGTMLIVTPRMFWERLITG